MGEYIQYRNEEVKIGTLENLYYVTYEKYLKAALLGELYGLAGNQAPAQYLRADAGFRFRFPFPDEDHHAFGDIGKHAYMRGVPIQLPDFLKEGRGEVSRTVELVQQKLVTVDGQHVLAPVFRAGKEGLFRLEQPEEIMAVADAVTRNHVQNAETIEQGEFYREIAARLINGIHPELYMSHGQRPDDMLRVRKEMAGLTVLIHPDLTTDPLNRQGWFGIITSLSPELDTSYVKFSDGRIGSYQSDGLLTLRPQALILQGFTSNDRELDYSDRAAMLLVLKHLREGEPKEALEKAMASETTRFYCVIDCASLIELKTQRQSKNKGLRP